MKFYYTACSVRFREDIPEEGTYYGHEVYSFIINAKNKKEGLLMAEKKGMEVFEADLGSDGLTEIRLTIDDFYDTTEEARAD